MKRNARLSILIMLALFFMAIFAYATPLESFAENPIPYWTDDSTDVNLVWNSTEQTVTFEADTPYWENMNDVSDWTDNSNFAHVDDTFTSNGTVATKSNDWGGGTDFDYVYDDSISINTSSGIYYLEFRTKSTDITDSFIYLRTEDGESNGDSQSFGTSENTEWATYRYLITLDVVEQITLGGYDDDGDSIQYYDYILIGERELNVSIPIESDTIQSIELMGNFSALNSTVRFQMYDNITAGIFCDVNSTQVTFPDSTYAEFSDVARINFSLNEERIIFKIYVYALNMTLINSYSSIVGPANNDYLFMTDSEFEGSYTLLYLQGDIGYLAEVIDTENIFYLLFLSLEMWGYLGPIALVVIGYFLVEKSVTLGVLWFIVECLFVANYLNLVAATPNYWWHIMILLLGGLFTCIFPLIDRK